ncbi:MAG: hypothetical protein AB4050_11480 [Synechococcus sp.]
MAFDLTTFPFTNGNDIVAPREEIFNSGLVNALDGNDKILVSLEIDASDNHGRTFGIFNVVDFQGEPPIEPIIDTGMGNDIVEGVVEILGGNSISGDGFGHVAGIAQTIEQADAYILTGPGRDRVKGATRIQLGRDVGEDVRLFATGISGGSIDTGLDRDVVEGSGIIQVKDGGDDQFARGISYAGISTGEGNDKVTGNAAINRGDTPIGESRFTSTAEAFLFFDINSGAGNDVIEGTAAVNVGSGTDFSVFSNGFLFGGIDTGEGNDTVRSTVEAIAGNVTDVDIIADGFGGFGGNLEIETGAGNDKVIADVFTQVGDGTGETPISDSSDGFDQVQLNTGTGNDVVTGTSVVRFGNRNGAVARANGITLSTIETEDGRDRVIGTARADVGLGTTAEAKGINSSTIETGDDRDVVTGLATAYGPGAFAIGISDSDILLGGGNDQVSARAVGDGTLIGIHNTTINAEAGNDVIKILNGNGNIDGGEGRDILIIQEGFSDDYTFTTTGASAGTIENVANSTNLVVSNVEKFIFNDGSFEFGELFV